MGIKILVGMIILLGVVTAWTVVNQRSLSMSVDQLMRQVSALETQNAALKKRLVAVNTIKQNYQEWVRSEINRQIQDSKTIAPAINKVNDNIELTALKSDLRQEVALLVDEERSLARKQRRAERTAKWHQGIKLSVADFVEDNGLSLDEAETITTLLEESFNQRRTLWKEVEAQNMSFYEFRQENKKNREALESEAAEILSEEQFEAFIESFPGRFSGRRGRQ